MARQARREEGRKGDFREVGVKGVSDVLEQGEGHGRQPETTPSF